MKPVFISTFFLLHCCLGLAQNARVEAVVTNPSGEPLQGVTVATPDASLGTTTNAFGAFSLVLPSGTDSLFFSYTGFQTLKISLPLAPGTRIVLQPAAYQLSEVVVVGFGEREKRKISSAISSTGAESFENISVSNWEQALQGRLPGVSITPASGGLDAAATIRVRGLSSISAGNQPLLVIDGIVLSALGGIESLGYFTNPLIALNPEDIASVEVLKDAAATSIYGARGSNGVILITTKKGDYNAKPRVSLGYYAGFSEITRRYNLLDGKEYAALWNEAAQNSGISDGLYMVEEQPSTDWQSLILRKGFVHQSRASVSGGTTNSRYFISGTFRDENGYLITTNLKRYALRGQWEQQIGERWNTGLSLAPTRVVNFRTGNQWAGSPMGWAAWYFPNVEAYDEQGQPIREPLVTSNGSGGFTGNPLLVLIDQEVEVVTQQLLARGHLQFSPMPSLWFRSELASETSHEVEWKYDGPSTFYGRNGGAGTVQHQNITSFQWTTQATWEPRLGTDHDLETTLGAQYVRTRFSGNYIAGNGFPNDQIKYLNATSQVREFFSWHNEFAFLGYFARANYVFRNRYLLSLSARYDGSSRFGAGRRYGFFPAASAGWILLDGDGRVSFLKFRSSIGLTGNAEIGDFTSRGLVAFNNDYLGQPGFAIQSLENRQLGWEKSLQWDAGLDFALWNRRIRGSVDYYIRDTRELLLEVPVPATNGVSVILENAGSMRNSGLEFALDADLLRGPFRWTVQLNGATLRNRILNLADLDGDGADDEIILNDRNLFRPGETAAAFYLVRYAGVDPNTGDALFYDLEGNTLVNQAPAENRQVAGKPLPGFTGGMGHSFGYRQFDLTAFFHFKTGHQLYLMHSALENNMQGNSNQLRTQLDAWTPDNPDTDVPQARLGQVNGSQPSTRYLHDADFIRLNNLTLGYTLPKLGKSGVALRLFASAQNLFTLTAFPGLDPDSEFYPAQSAAQGGVLYNLPASRTYAFGLNLTL